MILNRGSEWSKWDLQVQPISNNWLGKYDAETLLKIENSTKEYLKIAKEKNIEVIGITDHNSGVAIDYAIEHSESVKILPGVELDTVEGWHLLVLFNENYKTKLKLKTWSEVVDYFLGTKCKMERPFFNENNTHKKIGCKTKDFIEDICNNDIGIVVFAHCWSNDGFFKKSDVQGRQEIIKSLIEGNIHFSFEIKNNFDQIQGIKDKIEGWYPSNTPNIPILSSSDAHKASEVGLTYSLIKATKSYEGLKQVLFEPNDRLLIGLEPNDDKTDYSVISSVKYIDENFIPNEIPLNQNLVTIIGGKSTGKSLLLRNIANTIDPEEVSKRHKEVGLELYSQSVKGFEVVWRDGQVSKLNSSENPSKKIIYIPQSYLNRLVEKNEEETSIDDIIKNVLIQDDDIKEAFEKLQEGNNLIQSKVAKNIEDLEQKFNIYNDLSTKIKTIGDKKGLESEISKIEKSIQDLKSKSGLSTEEISKYNELIKSKDIEIKTQSIVENDIVLLKKLYLEKQDIIQAPFLANLSDSIETKLKVEFETITVKTLSDWKELIENQITELELKLTISAKQITEIDVKLKPFSGKLNNSKILITFEENLESEKLKLNKLQIEQTKFDDSLKQIQQLVEDLSDSIKGFYTNYLTAKSIIIKQDLIKDEMDFDLDIQFKEKQFNNNFVLEVFNGVKLSTYSRSNDLNISEYKFETIEKIKSDFKKLIYDFINKKIEPVKRYQTLSSSLQMLLKNWFVFDFKLTSQGDRFNEMSSGKKAFILLKLLIDLDKLSKYPILLDQPEDDWDNRSLYGQLRKFIKEKKKERQIIIVTHNPNLVVGTDSEQVIVANQNGNSTPNSDYKFEYCSGALENTGARIQDEKISILNRQGIKEHVCDILEGGEIAFKKREQKYGISTVHNNV